MSESLFPADEPALLIGPPGLKLRTASVSESLGRPYRIDLEIVGEGDFVPSNQVLGKPMAVQVNLGGPVARYFHGLVSEFYFLGTQARVQRYRAILRPWIWFLSRSVNCRIFQNITVPDIIKAVFDGHDFADLEPAALDGYALKEFVVQYRESDLNFVTRLMEEEGIYYYFKHTVDRHALVLCDGNHTHEPVPGFEELPYFPPDLQRKELVANVDVWEISSRVEANVYVSKDFDFEKPEDPLLVSRSATPGHALGDLEVFDYPGEYIVFADGEARARLRIDEQRALAESFSGHSNARTITSGTLLGLVKHTIGECNGQYLVLSTVLTVSGHGLESGDLAGGIASCDFVAIRAQSPFRLPRTTPKPHIIGAQTAIVVTPEGQEVDSDLYGRVRVKFHWDRRSNIPFEEISCPVRVSQLWAGSGFGGIHIPRKGQEVLVEFLEGDPDRPIITGRVYNGLNAVPYELPKHQTQSGIKTSTVFGETPNYNELRFEDEKGKEEVFIQAERNKTVNVKRSRSATIGGSDSIYVGGNRSVDVTGNLSVAVGDKGGEYKLEATKCVDVVAPEYIELKCKDTTLRLTPEGLELRAGGKAFVLIDTAVHAQSSKSSFVRLDDVIQSVAKDGGEIMLDMVGAKVTGTNIVHEGKALVDIKAALVKINS